MFESGKSSPTFPVQPPSSPSPISQSITPALYDGIEIIIFFYIREQTPIAE